MDFFVAILVDTSTMDMYRSVDNLTVSADFATVLLAMTEVKSLLRSRFAAH